MNVAPAVMVMADRNWPVTVWITVRIRNLVWSHVDMNRMVIVAFFDQGDNRPVRCMTEVMLRLRHAVQAHGRQKGDAQTDAEVADGWRQMEAPVARLTARAVGSNA